VVVFTQITKQGRKKTNESKTLLRFNVYPTILAFLNSWIGRIGEGKNEVWLGRVLAHIFAGISKTGS